MKLFKIQMALLLISCFSASSSFASDPTEGLPTAVAKRHALTYMNAQGKGDCESDLITTPMTHDLQNGFKLYLVSCIEGMGVAATFKGYITQKGASDVTSVSILDSAGAGKGIIQSTLLKQASFDEVKKTLSTAVYGDAGGSCGSITNTSITTTIDRSLTIKPLQVQVRNTCDGNAKAAWSVIFQQKK